MKKDQGLRITVRLNALEAKEFEAFKEQFQIEDNSKAIKIGFLWAKSYLKNVTDLFIPPDYDIVLYKRLKTFERKTKVIREKD